MGVSTYFSLRKYDFKLSWPAAFKILRRTVVIFAIGIFITWFSKTMYGSLTKNMSIWDAMTQFDTIRVLGVMPRLALCYGIGSLIALTVHRRGLPWLIGGMLVLYTIILVLGDGFIFDDRNVIAVVDRAVLGPDHMYTDTIAGKELIFDPEGLLSTLPSIAHMLIGFMVGSMIVRVKDNTLRINNLFILGTILTFVGFLLDYSIPINKKIWSPTFVLTTCGLAASFLGLLIWIIDIKGYKKWCRFFESFGINPLFMYVLGSLLGIIFGAVNFGWEGAKNGVISIKNWIYEVVLMPVAGGDATLSSLLYAIVFVCIVWLFGYYLYKNKIYIKI